MTKLIVIAFLNIAWVNWAVLPDGVASALSADLTEKDCLLRYLAIFGSIWDCNGCHVCREAHEAPLPGARTTSILSDLAAPTESPEPLATSNRGLVNSGMSYSATGNPSLVDMDLTAVVTTSIRCSVWISLHAKESCNWPKHVTVFSFFLP